MQSGKGSFKAGDGIQAVKASRYIPSLLFRNLRFERCCSTEVL
jgi:hypothetical protein